MLISHLENSFLVVSFQVCDVTNNKDRQLEKGILAQVYTRIAKSKPTHTWEVRMYPNVIVINKI